MEDYSIQRNMTLREYKIQRSMLEGSVKLAIERAIEKFQNTTNHCPSKLEIEMLDVTDYIADQGAKKWQIKKRFKVGRVRAIIDI